MMSSNTNVSNKNPPVASLVSGLTSSILAKAATGTTTGTPGSLGISSGIPKATATSPRPASLNSYGGGVAGLGVGGSLPAGGAMSSGILNRAAPKPPNVVSSLIGNLTSNILKEAEAMPTPTTGAGGAATTGAGIGASSNSMGSAGGISGSGSMAKASTTVDTSIHIMKPFNFKTGTIATTPAPKTAAPAGGVTTAPTAGAAPTAAPTTNPVPSTNAAPATGTATSTAAANPASTITGTTNAASTTAANTNAASMAAASTAAAIGIPTGGTLPGAATAGAASQIAGSPTAGSPTAGRASAAMSTPYDGGVGSNPYGAYTNPAAVPPSNPYGTPAPSAVSNPYATTSPYGPPPPIPGIMGTPAGVPPAYVPSASPGTIPGMQQQQNTSMYGFTQQQNTNPYGTQPGQMQPQPNPYAPMQQQIPYGTPYGTQPNQQIQQNQSNQMQQIPNQPGQMQQMPQVGMQPGQAQPGQMQSQQVQPIQVQPGQPQQPTVDPNKPIGPSDAAIARAQALLEATSPKGTPLPGGSTPQPQPATQPGSTNSAPAARTGATATGVTTGATGTGTNVKVLSPRTLTGKSGTQEKAGQASAGTTAQNQTTAIMPAGHANLSQSQQTPSGLTNPGKLTDFRVRNAVQKGIAPGRLRDYIEAPIVDTMSNPPQSSAVKSELRKYLIKKKIPTDESGDKSKIRIPQYDLRIEGNVRVDGVYEYREKTIQADATTLAAAQQKAELEAAQQNAALPIGSPPIMAPQVSLASLPSKHKKWYANTKRKVIMYYQVDKQRWIISEKRLMQQNLVAGSTSNQGQQQQGQQAQQAVVFAPATGMMVENNNANPQRKIEKVYGPQELICWCESSILQPEYLPPDQIWFDWEGNRFGPNFIIKPKARPMSKSPRGKSPRAKSPSDGGGWNSARRNAMGSAKGGSSARGQGGGRNLSSFNTGLYLTRRSKNSSAKQESFGGKNIQSTNHLLAATNGQTISSTGGSTLNTAGILTSGTTSALAPLNLNELTAFRSINGSTMPGPNETQNVPVDANGVPLAAQSVAFELSKTDLSPSQQLKILKSVISANLENVPMLSTPRGITAAQQKGENRLSGGLKSGSKSSSTPSGSNRPESARDARKYRLGTKTKQSDQIADQKGGPPRGKRRPMTAGASSKRTQEQKELAEIMKQYSTKTMYKSRSSTDKIAKVRKGLLEDCATFVSKLMAAQRIESTLMEELQYLAEKTNDNQKPTLDQVVQAGLVQAGQAAQEVQTGTTNVQPQIQQQLSQQPVQQAAQQNVQNVVQQALQAAHSDQSNPFVDSNPFNLGVPQNQPAANNQSIPQIQVVQPIQNAPQQAQPVEQTNSTQVMDPLTAVVNTALSEAFQAANAAKGQTPRSRLTPRSGLTGIAVLGGTPRGGAGYDPKTGLPIPPEVLEAQSAARTAEQKKRSDQVKSLLARLQQIRGGVDSQSKGDGNAGGVKGGATSPLPRDPRADIMGPLSPNRQRDYDKHIYLAEDHEGRIFQTTQTPRGTKNGAVSLWEMSLAIREYKEALRIKPSDNRIRSRVHYLQNEYRKHQKDGAPQQIIRDNEGTTYCNSTIPMLRFVRHYNLCLRYWDKGKSYLAIKECENAIGYLARHNLPLIGMIDILDKMNLLQSTFREKEQSMVEKQDSKYYKTSKNKTSYTRLLYHLGILYWDKRMLTKSEQFMLEAEKSILDRCNLAVYKKDGQMCRNLREDLENLQDDILFIKEFQSRFCTECQWGVFARNRDQLSADCGLRDGIAPGLLPCFLERFDPNTEFGDAKSAESKSARDDARSERSVQSKSQGPKSGREGGSPMSPRDVGRRSARDGLLSPRSERKEREDREKKREEAQKAGRGWMIKLMEREDLDWMV